MANLPGGAAAAAAPHLAPPAAPQRLPAQGRGPAAVEGLRRLERRSRRGVAETPGDAAAQLGGAASWGKSPWGRLVTLWDFFGAQEKVGLKPDLVMNDGVGNGKGLLGG